MFRWFLLIVIVLTTSNVQSATNGEAPKANTIQAQDEDGELFIPTATSNRSSSSQEPVDGSGGDVLLVDSADGDNNETGVGTRSWPYWIDTGCAEWLPINHVYFQLANTFLFLSYLAPAGLYGLLYLRLMLAIGCAFFAIWGWLILCAIDTLLWNAFFTLINVVHGLIILCSLRPVRFDKQVEEVYKTIFQPLKVSKQQFKKVVNCMKCIKGLKRGEHFAVEKQTKVETLSLLLSGSMLVIENKKTLHVLSPMQFLDSPEWFGVSNDDDFFQVSIRACEESRVLQWHRDKLKLILLTDAFLAAVFDHILGIDVVRKMTQMKEKIASPHSGSPFRNNLNASLSDSEKTSSSLSTSSKSSVHGHGGLIVSPEKFTLLDENQISSKKFGKPVASNKTGASNTGNRGCDYSIVQHLDSTDI